MFDVWSFVIGIIIGCSLGIAIVALLHGNKQYDDDPEYWFKQLGRRSDDK